MKDIYLENLKNNGITNVDVSRDTVDGIELITVKIKFEDNYVVKEIISGITWDNVETVVSRIIKIRERKSKLMKIKKNI